MSVKQVSHYSEIEDKIIRAVDTVAGPVIASIGPRGYNTIFENDFGDITSTNDGVTIAKSITVADPYEDAIIQIIKQSALKTNSQAGDGTSTTVLLSSILIKDGLKLIREGIDQRDITESYKDFADVVTAQLEKQKRVIKSDDDLFAVTKISANNDESIAKDVVKVVNVAGEDGYIFLEPSNTKDTEIKEDTGFLIEAGMLTPELVNAPGGTASYQDVPVLITDKRLYYAQEAETILNTVLQNGYREVVIVAKDFIGEAVPFFVANHQKGTVRALLVKDPNVDKTNGATLTDLANYLNGEVISENNGKIVDKLTMDNFIFASKVYSDAAQTVIMRDPKTEDTRLKERVAGIKAEMKKFGDEDTDEKKLLKKRLASLTNGVVTIRIGGTTPIEVKERKFRYEDAINAGRAAMKDGYLLGGGVSILRAVQGAKFKKDTPPELLRVFNKIGEANVRQLAENSGVYPDGVVEKLNSIESKDDPTGFDALSKTYVNLEEAGIFDPFKVTQMAILNSVSIANAILSSRYMIITERTNVRDNNTETSN